jgi:catechol 2,3-dioxygenase-like lactoylglutathione lyase family enzyme
VFDGSIQGLTIEVQNLERSRRFYEDVLGFEPGAFYEPTRWQPYNFGAQFFGIREIPRNSTGSGATP